MAFINIGDLDVHYRFDGPADAPMLVLSHSLGADLNMWDPQISSFAGFFRVLRYDTRGHGLSTVTPGPYTIERLGQDAVGLLDALDIPKAHFCGLSMGGMIGMWLGLYAPRKVDRLVLCNTAARIGTAEIWNERLTRVQQNGMTTIVASVMDRWFTSGFIAKEPAIVEPIRLALSRTPVEGYVACGAAVRDFDVREQISRVRAPTLVVAGSVDVSTPPGEVRMLAEKIAGAKYLELAAAHLSNIEAAHEFTAAILKFLTGSETGAWMNEKDILRA